MVEDTRKHARKKYQYSGENRENARIMCKGLKERLYMMYMFGVP